MTKRIIGVFGAILITVNLAHAQGRAMLAPPVITVGGVAVQEVAPAMPMAQYSGCCDSGLRFWATSEFLLWRLKSPPINSPLISVNTNPATIAALNEPGTGIAFGAGSNESTNLDWFAGMRFTLGAWIDDEQSVGLEASGFLLERRSLIYGLASAGGANPVLAIPINSVVPFLGNPAGETSQNSGGLPNRITAHLNARLWGAEANGLVGLMQTDRCQLVGLIGFRYLDLVENLSLSDTIDLGTPGSLVYINDGFGTRNQFYGGQIGARATMTRGRWQLETAAKVAFGSTHQVLSLTGESSAIVAGAPVLTTPQGTLVESTNRGSHNRNVFAVVPEVQVNLGFQLTPRVVTFLGYNWMYLSNALRPGNQIDRNVNPTQQPLFVPPGTLTGPPAPLPVLRSGDFWAQGFNLGMMIRY